MSRFLPPAQTAEAAQPAIDGRLLAMLGFVAGLVIVLNVLLIPFGDERELLGRYFVTQVDLNSEATFVAWLSSALLLLNSLCAYWLARHYWSKERRIGLLMAAMSAGFLLLSIDDTVGLHEQLEAMVAGVLSGVGERDSAEVQGELGPVFAFVLLFMLAAFFARPYYRATKGKDLPLLVATLLCVFMVAFSELAWLRSGCGPTWCFRAEVVLEEGSELGAAFLFLTFQSRELARASAA